VHAESELRLQERAKLFEDRSDPAVHSEIRDPETAAEAVRLACRLALANQRRLHILHLSTRLELDAVLAARELGMENGAAHRSITSEVCPHHLFMNTDAYERYGTRVRMNPPLRGEDDRQAMWDGLCRGKVDIIATDHAPHSIEDKTRPYRQAPSGVPGVQTMLPLMLDAAFRGLCTPEQVLQWLCHGPADVWGIRERGRLEVGNPADLVLIDPLMIRKVSDAEQFSKCRWTPWAERTLTGWPVLTLVGGQVAYRRDDSEPGQVVGEAGLGNEVEFSA
ncbi:MAG: amidohydrolase family protein, partial [Bradymonadaceae bacterium]